MKQKNKLKRWLPLLLALILLTASFPATATSTAADTAMLLRALEDHGSVVLAFLSSICPSDGR